MDKSNELLHFATFTRNGKYEFKNLNEWTCKDVNVHFMADILRHMYRWNAIIPHDYLSVLSHCLNVEALAIEAGESNEFMLWCLLHDFSESVVGDIISPIKHSSYDIEDLELFILELVYQSIDENIPNWVYDKASPEYIRFKEFDDKATAIELKTITKGPKAIIESNINSLQEFGFELYNLLEDRR